MKIEYIEYVNMKIKSTKYVQCSLKVCQNIDNIDLNYNKIYNKNWGKYYYNWAREG